MREGSANLFYCYLNRGQKAVLIRARYVLDEELSEERLAEALSIALKTYTLFRAQPVLDEAGLLHLQEASGPLPVFAEQPGVFYRIGSKETGGYLFTVSYRDNELYLTASHALGDVRAVLSFGDAVLYHYYTLGGYHINHENRIHLEENTDQTQAQALLEDVCRDSVAHTGRAKKSGEDQEATPTGCFLIPEEPVYADSGKTKLWRICYDVPEMRDAVHALGSGFTAFLAAMAADALFGLYETEQLPVIASVPVDLRPILGIDSQSNFTANVSLSCGRDLMEKSITEKTRALQTAMRSQMTREKLLGIAGSYIGLTSVFRRIPPILPNLEQQIYGRKPTFTYLLSNVGMLKLPADLERHVLDFELSMPSTENTPCFFPVSYQNRGQILVSQNYEDSRLLEKLCESLSAFGVTARLADGGTLVTHTMPAASFQRTSSTAK